MPIRDSLILASFTYLRVACEGLKEFKDLWINFFWNVHHQSSIAEATVVQELNQGVCTDVLYYHPCLLLFPSREKVKNII